MAGFALRQGFSSGLMVRFKNPLFPSSKTLGESGFSEFLGMLQGLVLPTFRSKTGGFRCALPEKLSGELSGELEAWWGLPGLQFLGRNCLRLNPLENPWWITRSRFKAVSAAGVPNDAADVMRASASDYGAPLRHSSGGGSGGCSSQRCPAPGLGGGCGWPDYSSARWCGGVEPRDLGRGERSSWPERSKFPDPPAGD